MIVYGADIWSRHRTVYPRCCVISAQHCRMLLPPVRLIATIIAVVTVRLCVTLLKCLIEYACGLTPVIVLWGMERLQRGLGSGTALESGAQARTSSDL